ncbi:MAG: IclR family transcriptional regulator [Pseudohongiella sp.]|nr:MAG: IclR family transcriptional regulator [Pseudohongiella sp.]
MPSSSIECLDIPPLLKKILKCEVCKGQIPEPNPIVRASKTAKILIIGQAPGRKVHESKIPWDDPSGRRLREWMGISEKDFYDESLVALLPMGFCYPGKGKSGDLPPRPECAPKWHSDLLSGMPNIEYTILIGQYAQNYYLKDNFKTLTERIQNWQKFTPEYYVLPHPSPRNQLWLTRNPWFEEQVLPHLKAKIGSQISKQHGSK